MNGLLGYLVAAVAILSGIGAAAAFLSAGRQSGRITALRGDIEDRDRRITFLEDENARHEETEKRQQDTIHDLQREVAGLRDQVAGAAGPTKDLRDLVKAHHEKTTDSIGVVQTQLVDVLALLGDKRTARYPRSQE